MAVLSVILASVGSYTLTSLILLHYPHLLHKPKYFKLCQHISHRGGAGENYENTMPAFTHAVNLGTDMLELDCHLTKDKQVVVAHDACLLRTTGHNLMIRDLNYHELPLLKTSIILDFESGRNFKGSEDESLRKIPLLNDVFKSFPEVAVNIDVKEGGDELIEGIGELIVAHKREPLTVWGSFREDASLKCHQQNPEVRRFFSLGGVIKLYLCFYIGLLPFITLTETHLELPLMVKDTKNLTRKQRLTWWLSSAFISRPALFRHLSKRGIPTYGWVLNSEAEFQRAFDMGVTGVMTDYPSKLRLFLLNHDL